MDTSQKASTIWEELLEPIAHRTRSRQNAWHLFHNLGSGPEFQRTLLCQKPVLDSVGPRFASAPRRDLNQPVELLVDSASSQVLDTGQDGTGQVLPDLQPPGQQRLVLPFSENVPYLVRKMLVCQRRL